MSEKERVSLSWGQIGPFLCLTPKRDQSGNLDKQLRITKEGNVYLRKLYHCKKMKVKAGGYNFWKPPPHKKTEM